MNWTDVLSNRIITLNGAISQYSDFDQEFTDIINLSSFRRLQDKAQVFPLETGDFSRTRLTHSIEAMATAERIGKKLQKHYRIMNITN
ncbi:MAG: hypothetical protein J5511_02240 [Bacilli bacterium]|nr:hypothetical protein [Bacilli bacterium]